MPAKKAARVQERRRVQNRRVRSSTRTAVRRAIQALEGPASAEAPAVVARAVSALDRAATKGVVHRNNAARRKSRLMKRLHKAATPE